MCSYIWHEKILFTEDSTAVTMEKESQARGDLWWIFPFRGVGQSLEAARNFGASLYYTLKGRFTLLREESFAHSW